MIIPQIKKSRFGSGIEAIRVPGQGVLVEVDAFREDEERESIAQIAESDTDYNINDHLSATYPVVNTPNGDNAILSLDSGYQGLQFFLSLL